MKSIFFSILSFLTLIISPYISAQEIGVLPNDPRIMKGTMSNGLTYYLVKNPVLKGYADFYLLQKVGVASEQEWQKGMTDLLVTMGLRNTKNFPNGDLFTYLDNLGMVSRRDFKMRVGNDECAYGLSNVPVGRGDSVMDSTLLAFFNFSAGINILPESLPSDKEFFANYFSSILDLQRRGNDQLRRNIMKGTRYYTPYPEAIFDMVYSYDVSDIRSYYTMWSRPDRQAIIVVGDIDPASVKSKILTLFQATPKYSGEEIDQSVIFPELTGPQFIIANDSEVYSSEVSLYLTTKTLPDQYRKTAVPILTDFMNSVMIYITKERLETQAQLSDFPISSISVNYGSFMDINNIESLKISVTTSPRYEENAFSFIINEIERINRYGVTNSEFMRAYDSYLNKLQYIYDWRMNLPNKVYVDRCAYNFLDDYSLASIEMLKNYIDKASFRFGSEPMNIYLKSFFGSESNRIFTFLSPINNNDVNHEERYRSLYESELAKQKERPISPVATALTFDNEPVPGKIVATAKEPITGATMWTLSNGALVLVKKTKNVPQRVSFEAFAKGGLSLLNDNYYVNGLLINDILDRGGIGSANSMVAQQLIRSKDILFDRQIFPSTCSASGEFSSDDLKTFLQIVNLNFTKFSIDDFAFSKYKGEIEDKSKYLSSNPQMQFSEIVGDVVVAKKEGTQIPLSSLLDANHRDFAVNFINESYSNAADFVFVFAGDIDEELLKEPVCKYIASLNGNSARKTNWKEGPYSIEKFDKVNSNTTTMSFPRCYHNFRFSVKSPFSVEEMALSNVVAQIIERKVIDRMLDEGVFVNANKQFNKYPEEMMTLDFTFMTKDLSKDSEADISNILAELADKGVDDKEVREVKGIVLNHSLSMENFNNSYWIEILKNRFLYAKDFYTKNKEAINSLSLSRVNSALKTYINTGAKGVTILSHK